MIETLFLFFIFLMIYSPAIVLAVFTSEAKQKRRAKAARKARVAERQRMYAARTQAQQIHEFLHNNSITYINAADREDTVVIGDVEL